MGNMAYCRFQNTEKDLRDCYRHLADEEADLSREELMARQRLIHLCEAVVEWAQEEAK